MATKLYFSVRDIQYQVQLDGYAITVTTDIPCHLYLRWSTVEPQTHIVPVYRRGIFMHGDTYFCFVVYTDLEQCQPGDTLIHTFLLLNWPGCQTRHFYFWGTITGIPCLSTTAIFHLHFTDPRWEYIILEPWTT